MLAESLLRLRYVAQATAVDLVAILDVSGSISLHDLELEKRCALALTSRCSNHQVAAIRFSHTADVVCHLTSDFSKYDEGLAAISSTDGGTDLAGALSLARDILSASQKPSNTKKAYVFTDGHIDVKTSSISANALKRLGCEIVVIGVGPQVSIKNLESVASLNRTFKVGNFEEALKLIENREDMRQNDNEIQVEMARLIGNYHLLSDPEIIVTIYNSGSKDLPAGMQMCIRTQGIGNPEYFHRKTMTVTTEPFKKQTSIEIRCTLRCASKTLTNVQAAKAFPSSILFSFLYGEKWITSNVDGCYLDWRHFCSNLHSLPPSPKTPKYNILLFGPMGSGKSSFVNSLKTTLSNRVQIIAHVDNKVSAVTQALSDHDLFPAITFLDCPGWEEDSIYQNEELRMILEGIVPFETNLRQGLTFHTLRRGTALEEWENRVHCVVMIVDVQHVANPDQMARLNRFLTKIKDTERPVFLVGTHADVVEDVGERAELIKKLEEEVADTEVLQAENYIAGDEKDFEKERKILVALYRALERSDDFMEREKLSGGKRVSLMYRRTRGIPCSPEMSGSSTFYSKESMLTSMRSPTPDGFSTADNDDDDDATSNTPDGSRATCNSCKGDGYCMALRMIRSKSQKVMVQCSECNGKGHTDMQNI